MVSLRRDQLIPVNKAVNTKEQLEKVLEEEEEKKNIYLGGGIKEKACRPRKP
jgi:hypothetical protein